MTIVDLAIIFLVPLIIVGERFPLLWGIGYVAIWASTILFMVQS